MTQCEKVAKHLKGKGSITSWEAIEKFRITRLSAVIFVLKERGFKISSLDRESINSDGIKSRWVEYRLVGEPS